MRIGLFAIIVIVLSFLFNQYFVHFSGDSKSSPEEALPTDHDYIWINGPKTDTVHRYFFLADGNYFGTGVVTKNLAGWSSGDGVFSEIPNSLNENEIKAAHSDNQILFGLIKPKGNIEVNINGETATLIELSTVSEELLNLYGIEGYKIWFIDLSLIEDKNHFKIRIISEQDNILNELSI